MRRHKIIIIFSGIIAVFLFFSFTVYSFVQEIQRKDLPVLGQVYNFSLIDEEGQPYQLSRLKDKIWIADFFFTTCGDICPMMTRNMAALNERFKNVDNVRLVSVTVNPEFDTAAVLKTFSRKHDAADNWIFLTGERSVIKDLAVKSFKLGSIEEPVFHSRTFSLVDRNGMIRGYYDGTNKEEIDKIYNDARRLLNQRTDAQDPFFHH